jgi:ketosteroid isomerase-like protein
MLHYLSEDARPLAAGLGLVALGFLIALWLTQRGKYLVSAGIALTLAVLVLVVEQFWVTDNERIEAVVEDLRQAVVMSDPDRVIAHLAPDVTVAGGDSSEGRLINSARQQITIAAIRQIVKDTTFDYVRVSRLTTNAGKLSRQGTAEFRVHAVGTVTSPYAPARVATPASGIDWSLGFRETSPGVWKVTRITPINPPRGFHTYFGMGAE